MHQSVVSLMFIICFLMSCASSELSPREQITREYKKTIDEHVVHTTEFSGLINTLDARVYFLNSSLRQLQIQKKAIEQKWSDEKLNQENESDRQARNSKSEFFISFFTPEDADNKLDSSRPTWKLVLISPKGRFDAKIKKLTGPDSEILSFYPLHNRWSLPYIAEFPIALSEIENQAFDLFFVGPKGEVKLSFLGPQQN